MGSDFREKEEPETARLRPPVCVKLAGCAEGRLKRGYVAEVYVGIAVQVGQTASGASVYVELAVGNALMKEIEVIQPNLGD